MLESNGTENQGLSERYRAESSPRRICPIHCRRQNNLFDPGCRRLSAHIQARVETCISQSKSAMDKVLWLQIGHLPRYRLSS